MLHLVRCGLLVMKLCLYVFLVSVHSTLDDELVAAIKVFSISFYQVLSLSITLRRGFYVPPVINEQMLLGFSWLRERNSSDQRDLAKQAMKANLIVNARKTWTTLAGFRPLIIHRS
ncbi:hypothetical protein Droror1_Dr00004856 [Drosera rotundifolia]